MIRCWFPEFYTECHRREEEGFQFAKLLYEKDIICSKDLTTKVNVVFFGGFIHHHRNRDSLMMCKKWNVPVIHYNWDLYPWQLNGDPDNYMTAWWQEYVEDLKWAREIWVPSQCTVKRTEEFTGRSARVMKCSIRPWEPDDPSHLRDGGYVVNVMRKYPHDPNCELVWDACECLGIPCKETATNEPWSKFKEIISGARLLISPYHEASTGGLTLLEGYWHGKPVLLSDSPMMGASDYFGERATYFHWNNPHNFDAQLTECFDNPRKHDIKEARQWINDHYSEASFAHRVAARIKEIVND